MRLNLMNIKWFSKKSLYLVIWIGCTIPCTVQPEQPGALSIHRKRLQKRIESILKLKSRGLRAGIMVTSLDSGEVLYSQSPDLALIPASVNKILTGYTALRVLSPMGTFKTQIYAVQPIRKGVLTGELYLKGGGDPSLVSERMWMLVNEFLRSGIKKITGNIIGDASYFDRERTPKTRPTYLQDQAYNAPVGALSFNFNTTTIFVQAGPARKSRPIVYSDPQNDYIDMVNQATTGSRRSKFTLSASRIKHLKGDLGDTVLLRGNMPLGFREVRYYRNIVNPTLYTCHMFQQFLERRKVKILGNVLEGKVPKNAKLLLDFRSLPLWQVVWGMNKFSNNFVADQILKKIGAEVWGPPGTLEKGIRAIQTELVKIGIPKNSYTIADGSGLTRQSRISARQVLTVLKAAYKDFSIAPEFISSLGVAGVDGTVRRRFLNSKAENLVRVKTGSLDGVASLAGYTPSADGEMLVFVILLNDPKGKYGKMTHWVDQIALAARQFTRN